MGIAPSGYVNPSPELEAELEGAPDTICGQTSVSAP